MTAIVTPATPTTVKSGPRSKARLQRSDPGMSFWTLANVALAIIGDNQARWLFEPADADAPLMGVSTDTRATSPGEVFFAIRGEKFDANEFIDQAAAKGAALIVIDRADAAQKLAGFTPRPGVLLVDDSVAALQRLAADYRDHLHAIGTKVIAIAGSNGKTTTRHLIHSVLSSTLRGSQSLKSFNNHIGVPVTLLSASETDQFVCVEAGTNHPGELEALGKIVRPDAIVITSIGHEHMEFFKTLEGVAKEEASILPFLAPNGLAVVPGDGDTWTLLEPYTHELTDGSHGATLLRFGEATRNDVRLRSCKLDPAGSRFIAAISHGLPTSLEVRLTLLGEHNARNALAAIAVARWMGLTNEAIIGAFAVATPVEMRLNVARVPEEALPNKQITIINDAYNANPDSMAAALRTLCEFPLSDGGRRVAILGDMRELGDDGPDLHRKIGRLVAELGMDRIGYVILIGRLSLFTADALARAWPKDKMQALAQWDESLPAAVAAVINAGDVVLFKASRRVGLERLVPEIQKRATDVAK
jgi:UDP-N-acetylmuramoyl-tripeptide--D-alanyl-D-alanine ligase